MTTKRAGMIKPGPIREKRTKEKVVRWKGKTCVDEPRSGSPLRSLAYYARRTASGASSRDLDDDGSEFEVADDEEI
jgi:hypothetical protein